MQVLLIGDHIQAFLKIVGVHAVERGGDIAGGVQGGAVTLDDQAGGHAPGFQVHHIGAVAFDQQVLLPQLVDHAVHLVVIKALARVAVKGNTQYIIHPVGILQGDLLEPVEDRQRFLVPVLDALEPGAAFIFQLGVLLRLLMEAHIQVAERLHAALLDLFLRTPVLVGGDHLAKLGAPVAQVIDAHGAVAQVIIDALEAVADGRGGQVADMEALGDVDGGIVDADRLALSLGPSTPIALAREHVFNGAPAKRFARQKEVQVAALDLRPLDQRVRDVARHFCRDLRRAHAQLAREREAGKGHIAHGRIRRDLQRAPKCRELKISLREGGLCRPVQCLCDDLPHVHPLSTPLKKHRLSYHSAQGGASKRAPPMGILYSNDGSYRWGVNRRGEGTEDKAAGVDG